MKKEWHVAVEKAVCAGVLQKSVVCELCSKNSKILDAHHTHGYLPEYWLIVQWLCRACHRKIHPGDREALREGQRKGLVTRMQKSLEERSLAAHKAHVTRCERYTSEEQAEQIKVSADKRRGVKRTDEMRKRMSEAQKGKSPWNKGLKLHER